ncbi:hypothetical protein CEXT_648031 [Caerostris extrusa]|uniref:Uncharacterized protein n=1 Tax=Caerostris extrusa TaxID=172846 RepID=A0AAV4V363_CAEEX|nr:hypothetical protein CEXT_648031 [Caerostris extrusa]
MLAVGMRRYLTLDLVDLVKELECPLDKKVWLFKSGDFDLKDKERSGQTKRHELLEPDEAVNTIPTVNK